MAQIEIAIELTFLPVKRLHKTNNVSPTSTTTATTNIVFLKFKSRDTNAPPTLLDRKVTTFMMMAMMLMMILKLKPWGLWQYNHLATYCLLEQLDWRFKLSFGLVWPVS